MQASATVAPLKRMQQMQDAAMQCKSPDELWNSLPGVGARSMVNYAAAPLGAKKYDSNWLASNATGAGRVS